MKGNTTEDPGSSSFRKLERNSVSLVDKKKPKFAIDLRVEASDAGFESYQERLCRSDGNCQILIEFRSRAWTCPIPLIQEQVEALSGHIVDHLVDVPMLHAVKEIGHALLE